jgi:hypothetical protein
VAGTTDIAWPGARLVSAGAEIRPGGQRQRQQSDLQFLKPLVQGVLAGEEQRLGLPRAGHQLVNVRLGVLPFQNLHVVDQLAQGGVELAALRLDLGQPLVGIGDQGGAEGEDRHQHEAQCPVLPRHRHLQGGTGGGARTTAGGPAGPAEVAAHRRGVWGAS